MQLGATDCLLLDTPIDALISIIKLSYERSLLQKQLKAVENHIGVTTGLYQI